MSRGSDLPDVSIADDWKGFVRRAGLSAEEVESLRPHFRAVDGEPWDADEHETTCPVCGASVAAQPRSLADHWLDNPDCEVGSPDLGGGGESDNGVVAGVRRRLAPNPFTVAMGVGWYLQFGFFSPLPLPVPEIVALVLGGVGLVLFPVAFYFRMEQIDAMRIIGSGGTFTRVEVYTALAAIPVLGPGFLFFPGAGYLVLGKIARFRRQRRRGD